MATISKTKKNVLEKTLLKWDYSDDFIADFYTDTDIILLKYTAQIRTVARLHNLH